MLELAGGTVAGRLGDGDANVAAGARGPTLTFAGGTILLEGVAGLTEADLAFA